MDWLLLHYTRTHLLKCNNFFPAAVMSFPAEGVEATIKNHIDDVRGFLDLHHANCYAVYNCSQRLYRASKFQNRVSVSVFDVHRYGCVNCVWQKNNIGVIRNLRMITMLDIFARSKKTMFYLLC